MKTLATEIKEGQTIKYGNQWGVVLSEPNQSSHKTNEVTIWVKTLPSKVNRRSGYTDSCKGGYETSYSYRKTTMVQTK